METIDQVKAWWLRLRSSGWLNKYTVALSVFLVWMMFFDKHNMLVQYQLHHRHSTLEKQIETDRQRLVAAREELRLLRTEEVRYAREKYRMHKPDEDVFIITRK